ncbi:MAG: hypothetical protein HZB65_03450 [Candidatus Aenigmarchaeota archaeon]|nr:hypothetical protein [Candidatus Aenigmarchaeota archaeon]
MKRLSNGRKLLQRIICSSGRRKQPPKPGKLSTGFSPGFLKDYRDKISGIDNLKKVLDIDSVEEGGIYTGRIVLIDPRDSRNVEVEYNGTRISLENIEKEYNMEDIVRFEITKLTGNNFGYGIVVNGSK